MSIFNKREREVREELESHLRMAAQDRMERGETRTNAEAEAQREFGNRTLVQEAAMEVSGIAWLERFMQDLRYGLRVMRRNPGASLVSILTLTLGIGASTAIFSVVYGVLLRPLPYDKPEQLVRVFEVDGKGHQGRFTGPNFDDVRAQNHSFQGIAKYGSEPETVRGGADSQRVNVSYVSKDFLSVMGVGPALGRAFSQEEQHPGAAPAILVSYSFWKESLSSATDLTKARITVGDRAATVIGVLPAGFHFPDSTDIWFPSEIEVDTPSRTAHNWRVVARLRDGVSREQAQADVSAIGHRLKQQYGQDIDMQAGAVVSLRDELTGPVRPALLILMGAVGFLLLVACANVVNLLLAQATAREGELAVRAALGASRQRLIRQFLAEALVLCLAGGACGLLASWFGVQALIALAPAGTPRLNEVGVNWPVLAFALALSVLLAIALGLFTAWRATGRDLQASLAVGGRQGSMHRSQRLGRFIIAGQLGVTLLLLVGAGLLGRSLLRVLSTDPGFRTQQIVTMNLALPETIKNKNARVELLSQLLEGARALPGVEEVGGTNSLPLASDGGPTGTFAVVNEQQLSPQSRELIRQSATYMGDGSDLSPAQLKQIDEFFTPLFHGTAHTEQAEYIVASEGYFRALAIPLVHGRLFDQRDTTDAAPVALISESLARQLWPHEDPIGHTIEFGNMDGDLRLLTIVGVVGDVHNTSLEVQPAPTVYVDYRQRPRATFQFDVVIHSAADPATTISEVRKIVSRLDPNLAPRFSTFTQVFSASLHDRRFNLVLLGTFAISALVLAIIGIYGVIAFSVALRTREIGVRMALGATTTKIQQLILGQATLTAVAGIVAGIAASFLLTRTMQSLLYQVSSTDPLTFAAVAVLLLAVAVLAAYVPARRATRVDPNIALRYQ
jgi:ABC-type antimicrobial peptide transport system permease subunit